MSGRPYGRPLTLFLACAACVLGSGIAPAAADRVIVIAGPASGPRATETEAIRKAVQDKASAINERGGVLGERIRLSILDDGCTATAATDAANRALQLKADAVIGHVCSSAAIAAAHVYGPAGVLFITPGARHRELTVRRAGPTIFRLAGRDDRQGAFTGKWLADTFKGRRIAIVSDRTAYARRLTEDARLAFTAAGGPPPVMLTIVAGEKDYGPLIGQVKATAAEAVHFAGSSIEAGVVLRQLRAAGSSAAFSGSDSVAADEFIGLASTNIEGVSLVVPSTHAAAHDERGSAERAAAALEIWADASQAAGSVEAIKVASELQRSPHATSGFGRITFDARGDSDVASFAILQCRAGLEPAVARSCTPSAAPAQ